MNRNDQEDKTIYRVVVNHEEQYSIWPAYRENPPGWRDAGRVGSKAECLAFIKEVWTDIRPLSLRKRMEWSNNGEWSVCRRLLPMGGATRRLDNPELGF